MLDRTRQNLHIAYPWITAEVVWNWKNIYEPNFNCWGLSSLLLALKNIQNENHKILIIENIRNMLIDIRNFHDKIILITDANIDTTTLEKILLELFWKNNFKILTTYMWKWNKNELSWSIIRDSYFSNEDELLESIKELSDWVVISSIPYSDPKITHILEKLWDFSETKSFKSFKLIDLNSDRNNHVKVAWEEIWNLWIIQSPYEINQYLEYIWNWIVVKPTSWSAGWTWVNFLLNESQVEAFSKLNWWSFIVNELIKPKFINDGENNYPFHIRPFFSPSWIYLWCTLKISEISIERKRTWSWKSSFLDTNRSLNTSAWLSKTIIFNNNWDPIIWFIDKNSAPLNQLECSNFLDNLSINGKKISSDEINFLALWSESIIKKVQNETNKLLRLI